MAELVAGKLIGAGIDLRVLADEAGDLDPASYHTVVAAGAAAAEGTEMVLVLGGDGTLLRAAELARPAGVPVLGVNLGRVGFLAEADSDDLHEAVAAVAERSYFVGERMTLDVTVKLSGQVLA